MQQFSKSDKTQISIIVPTLNEEENIDVLIERLIEIFNSTDYVIEILIADGGSTDATQLKVKAWASLGSVRFVCANSGRGLAGDVLVAAREACGEVIVVMDADLSHSPEKALVLAKLVLENACDMAIGSRYVHGGTTPDWSWVRRIISRGAGLFAWPFVDVRDPTSGFFSVRREKLLNVDPNARGFKIALEVLFSAGDGFRVKEVAICFRDRSRGHSKMSIKQAGIYLSRLMVLAGSAGAACNAMRFALASLVGLIVDLGIFYILWSSGIRLPTAHIFSFFIASVISYTLISQWAFRSKIEQRFFRGEYIKFLVLGLMVLFLRGGVIALFMRQFSWPVPAALIAAIFVTVAVNYLGCAFFVFPQSTERMRSIHWRMVTLSLIGYSLLLRLVYLGLPNLLPQEAYYWNYAQHPAFGYLDHPPMVAWLIKFGTLLFKHSEFGVRFGSFVSWFITAGFCFGFARNMFNKKTAFQAVLFFSLLPLFFFMTGFFIAPDVSLLAAWAGALFFLERALLADRRLAWWGVGICFGLGMFSKYTMALLGLATLLFILLDKRSRRWLFRPEPYAAMILAFLIFTPVILWNANNNWASFFFQSTRRFGASPKFYLPVLIGSVLILLTPLGAIGVVQSIFNKRIWSSEIGIFETSALRKRLFSLVFTLVPLFTFVLFSIKHQPKLNWTCPIWLAIMPVLARYSLPEENFTSFRRGTLWQRFSMPTLIVLACIYGGVLHYVSIGLPGVPYPKNTVSPVAWKEMGNKVEQIENTIEGETGKKPLVVGMDKYFIASELAFYRGFSKQKVNGGSEDTCSVNLFKEEGLMYGWWFPRERQTGKTCIIVSIKSSKLSDGQLAEYFDFLGPVQKVYVTKDNVPAGCFFYRVAKGYIRKN
jgi:dolichol-phosphate mannosyltransferase